MHQDKKAKRERLPALPRVVGEDSVDSVEEPAQMKKAARKGRLFLDL
jgi:hypothetical protein